jgi:type IV secretion system protein VirB6
MTGLCAAADISDIAALMASVDCQTAAYVENAYRGLFGETGALSAVLAGALTIYVAFYGYRLMIGAQGLAVPSLVRRFVGIGFIIAFATNWPAYQTAFVSTVTGGAEEVAGLMSAATGGRVETSITVAERLGETIEDITTLADEWSRKTSLDAGAATLPPGQDPAVIPPIAPPPNSAPASAVNMLWLSATLLGVGSAGVIVITKIILAFLLALGPAFMMLALFSGSRGLFEGWLRALAASALVLAFTVLATAGALSVVAPMVDVIADEQAAGVNNARSVFALAIASIVFALLIQQILTATARVAAAWRLPLAEKDARAEGPAHSSDASKQANPGDPRIADLVASVSRTDAAGRPERANIAPVFAAQFEQGAEARSDGVRRATRAYRGFGSSGFRAAGGLR